MESGIPGSRNHKSGDLKSKNTRAEHSPRAAEFARSLSGDYFELDDHSMGLLHLAIRDHTEGFVHDDLTISVCWDADQLDLPRVGIKPHPKYFGTEAARNLLKR